MGLAVWQKLRSARVPDIDPGGGVRFVSPDPGGKICGIACAGEPLGIWQHYEDRAYLCEQCLEGHLNCSRCLAGQEKRWKGFLPILIGGPQKWSFCVLEVTREAWQKFLAGRATPAAAELLGYEVVATRMKGNKFAPCSFYRTEKFYPGGQYVDVRPHVARLYRVHRLHA